MYPVSEDYKIKIKENERIFDIKITINHSKGQLELYDKDLVHGSLIYKESTQSGDDFTIGGTVASDIELKIFNKEEYDNIVFVGATIFVDVGLLVEEGVDAHFLQPSQPSKMKDFDDKVEYVRLGKFHIDIANRLTNTIELKAIDSMILLDKPYDLSKLSYPATLYQIYTNICHIAQLPIGTQNFTNMNYIVKSKPTGDLSLRSILGYVAELSGTFAKVNRNGALELRWYEQTDLNIEPSNRFKLELSDDIVQIKGILVRVKENEDDEDEVVYLTGSDEYAIDLSENPLLQDEYDVILPNILNNIKDTIFIPYTAECQSNPAIESGDIIKHTTIDGKVVDTIVTKLTYKYMGKSTLEANGLPEVTKDFKGSTDRKITLIKNKIDKEIDTKLTGVEQAQLNATELMSNMLGGHLIEDKKNGIIYIADNPNIDNATKIWKWGTGGFGYSDDGGETWTTAITADGSIVAELVSAGIITADMVRTGLLESEDGSTWINLDNGSFNFQNKLIWDGNNFKIQTVDGDDVIFKGIGLKIQNQHGDDVLKGDIEGNLMLVGQFVTYNNNNKAMEMSKTALKLYDWEGSTREENVGRIFSGRKEYDENKPGIILAHGKNAYCGISYKGEDMHYSYVNFDKDEILGERSGYPIIFYERASFNKKILLNHVLGFPNNCEIYGSDGHLVLNSSNFFTLRSGSNTFMQFDPSESTWKLHFWNHSQFNNSLKVLNNFTVGGSKNSLQKTKNYGERLINAYETAEYYFGDIGSGRINGDGECVIHIDEIFQECINTNINYHVFLQKEGQGDLWVKEKYGNYFIVKGTPNLEFSWELKAKRKGYEYHRLEVHDVNESVQPVNFDDELLNVSNESKSLKELLYKELTFNLENKLLGGYDE